MAIIDFNLIESRILKSLKTEGIRGIIGNVRRPATSYYDDIQWWGTNPDPIGPDLDFCQVYQCPRLCQNKNTKKFGCGKNGGQPIGKVPYKNCTLGIVAHAIEVMTIKPDIYPFFTGVDLAINKHDDIVDSLTLSAFNLSIK